MTETLTELEAHYLGKLACHHIAGMHLPLTPGQVFQRRSTGPSTWDFVSMISQQALAWLNLLLSL